MKSKLSLFIATVFVFSLALDVRAMQHKEHEGQGTKTEKTETMEPHSGHGTSAMIPANVVDLGTVTEKGVKATGHLNDVTEIMKNMGMPQTHHFMVMFTDEKSGQPIVEGMVALKIRDQAGIESSPIRLEGMEGHFGADIMLEQKGLYEFNVGTALIDGVKRQYQFKYEYK